MSGLHASPLVALVVEDDVSDAAFFDRQLKAAVHLDRPAVRLIHTISATSACSVLRHLSVDVIVLDLTLPDAYGLEAVYRLRSAAPAVPIVVLTAMADEEMALNALRAGAQDYMLKPSPDGEVLSRIFRYAGERQVLLQERDASVRAAADSAKRWRLVAEVGRAFAAADDPRQAISDVSKLLVPFSADCFVLFVFATDDAPLIAEVGHVDPTRIARVREQVQSLLLNPDAGLDPWTGGSDAMAAHSIAGTLQPVFDALGSTTGTVVPVRYGGQVRGFLLLATASARLDADIDFDFARSLSDTIGMALERDRLLHATRAAVAARDRALSIVSHDLRNPLNTIRICATALLDPDPAPIAGIRQMGELIQRSAEWMQHTVQDLLDRANLDAGRLPLHRRRVEPYDLVGTIAGLFRPLAAEREIDLVVNESSSLPAINADPDRLVQVLSNLVSNAIQFTPPGGQVAVSAAADDDIAREMRDPSSASVRFTVRDTGAGIAPESLDHVFDWFWRAPGGRGSGTGLGLAIAKGLVEAHGGRLRVQSAPGAGTSFWFSLPAADVPNKSGVAEMTLT